MTRLEHLAYIRSSLAFLMEEFRGSSEAIRIAAGAVQVLRGTHVITIADLHRDIADRVARTIRSQVVERYEAAEARECFNAAGELDVTAGRALLTYSGYAGVDLDALERTAADGWAGAHLALYGSPWE